jgi:hypothetical protein
MGRINQGISGGFSGTVGTVVGGNWKGIDYMRAKETGRSDARSAAQLDQRARFLTVIAFLKPLKDFLRVGFKSRAVRMSAFNAATSYHLEKALQGISPDYAIDYSKVMVSQGPLPGVLNPLAISGAGGQIKFTWENNSRAYHALGDDQVIMVIYNPLKEMAIPFMGSGTRMGGSQTITLPANFSGDEVHCYIAFQKSNQSVISDSRFVGSLTV